MNVIKFKEIVEKWENSKENFSFFRTWANNSYQMYCKNYDLEYAEENKYNIRDSSFENTGTFDKLKYEWFALDYDDVINMYNQMGWELDDNLKKKSLSHDDESDSLYYDISLQEIYKKVEKIEDNIEFFYALLVLVREINENRKIYKEYVRKIYNGITESGLEQSLKLLDNSKKVFIAMNFDDSMKKARSSIKKAIKGCGYTPILIDIKEHNNQIVAEIYKEIEDSKFVVADLTGQREGVYFEAGYAMAKQRPLILCCSKKEIKKVHFDVAQINTIFWEDEDDLKERLIKRINSTI